MSEDQVAEEGQVPSPNGTRKEGRGFFALNVHQFDRIRSGGLGLEEAAAYLSLLVSTDQGSVTSSGDINSIVEYTGLTPAEACKAVQRLGERGAGIGEGPRGRA